MQTEIEEKELEVYGLQKKRENLGERGGGRG